MWKSVTRSIRESLERRVCRTNVYSHSSQDGNNNTVEKKECPAPPPSLSSTCQDYFGNTKHSGAKDDEQSHYNAEFTWIDAFSWSSFLAVGFVVCQSLCLNRKLFEIDNKNLNRWCDKLSIYQQTQAFKPFNRFERPKLNQILELSDKSKEYKNTRSILNIQSFSGRRTYRPSTPYISPINNDFDETDSKTEILSDNKSDIKNVYGPITAQEALEKAINEFSSTHQTIIGELELDSGSKALEEKRYEDAFEHFITGSKLSSVGSMFNLALCYELGLGTTVDFAKAVKYYKKAADKGHIDALYNLGVFYAQGKGGLKKNRDIARQLFMKAATKGQVQALKALQLEESSKKNSDFTQNSKYNYTIKTEGKSLKNNILTKLNSYNNNLMTNLIDERVGCDGFKNSCDGYINTKSSINTFLPPSEEDSYYYNVAWTIQSNAHLPVKANISDWRLRAPAGMKSTMV